MEHRDYRDVISGLVLTVIGLIFAYYSLDYRLGTVARVGPGFPPLVLGLIMAGLGVAIAVMGARRWVAPGQRFAFRPFVTIIGAIFVFALTIRSLGLMPATLFLVVVATFATGRLNPRFVLILALSLTGLAHLIFVQTLGLPIIEVSPALWAWAGGR